MTKALIYHRDVSAGNILICPTVVTCDDGKRRVVWKGLLTDWELSKPMMPDGTQLAARQPRRTVRIHKSCGLASVFVDKPTVQGTWQFTSAWLLDHMDAAVTTADEIESVFWIILYNALRYLRHTCINVSLAMFDLFDNYDYHGTQYRCGSTRRETMTHGSLPDVSGQEYEFLDDECENTHPINAIIGKMLTWFKARYAKLKAPHVTNAIKQYGGDSSDTRERDERAKNLDDHTALLDFLDESLQRCEWPTDDKLGDLIKDPSLAHLPQIAPIEDEAPASPEEEVPAATDSNDDGDGDRRRARRKRTRRKPVKPASRLAAVIEDDEELPQYAAPEPEPLPVPTVRNRDGRKTRVRRGTRTGYGLRGSSHRGT